MRFILCLSIIFCFVLNSHAQVQPDPDSEQKSIRIPAKESKEPDSTPKPKPIQIKPELNKNNSSQNTINGFPIKIRELKPKKNEFSMFDNSDLRDPGELFEKRYNSKLQEQGIKMETMPDIFLGDVRVSGRIANIRCRDHKHPDGDLVQVVVNKEIIIPRLLLTANFKSFDIPLKEGINSVVFIALNQGESGPNTAEFEVYDDNNVLVSSRQWNLLTGVKATILVIKNEDMPQLKTAPQSSNEDDN